MDALLKQGEDSAHNLEVMTVFEKKPFLQPPMLKEMKKNQRKLKSIDGTKELHVFDFWLDYFPIEIYLIFELLIWDVKLIMGARKCSIFISLFKFCMYVKLVT